MARAFVSLMVLIALSLPGWLLLTGETDLRPASQPWWRPEDYNEFYYETVDALVAYFGPFPVGVGLLLAGPVCAAFTFFVIRPRSIWRRRRLF